MRASPGLLGNATAVASELPGRQLTNGGINDRSLNGPFESIPSKKSVRLQKRLESSRTREPNAMPEYVMLKLQPWISVGKQVNHPFWS